MQGRFLSREFAHQLLDFESITHGINFVDMLISLFLVTMIGVIIGQTYKKVQTGINYSTEFKYTIILTGIIVTIIMAVVGSNIARAFSLVGALSIIRFRTAVRSPLDITFIFFSIAMGLCLGSRFYITAILSTSWFVSFVLIFNFLQGRFKTTSESVICKLELLGEDLDTFKSDIQELKSFEIISYTPNEKSSEVLVAFYDVSTRVLEQRLQSMSYLGYKKFIFNS